MSRVRNGYVKKLATGVGLKKTDNTTCNFKELFRGPLNQVVLWDLKLIIQATFDLAKYAQIVEDLFLPG